ncbi:MAG: amino acid ABC transporter substrate-binding protein [Anaerolineae bacterium]|nr:amino acid ABC transporter substrate-binding protein [Anaerolineae bacterium]
MIQRGFLIIVALLTALVMIGCGAQATPAPAPAEESSDQAEAADTGSDAADTESEAAPAADAPAAIEVGAVVPLTGPFAGGGAQVERGYQMAVEAINAEGGVYVKEYDAKIPLHLTILDDESDPSKTVSHLETLYSDNDVVAYLGGFGSSLHAAAAAIAEKNQVPYLGVAFALWKVHQQGYKYLFSPFIKSPAIAAGTFEFFNALPEGERPLRVGILQEQTDWGVELGGLWREEAEKAGYEVVLYEEYAPGSQDFTDIILKAKEADVQMLLALPIPPDGLTIYKQMSELDYSPQAAFFIRAPDVPTWSEALGSSGDYVLLAPGWHNAVQYPGVDELNAKHQEMMDRPADPQVGPSYAAVQILADAIERAGTLDRAAIRDAIAATDLDTVAGHMTFNEDGTGKVPFVLLQYQSGKPELVWPAEFASAEFVYPAPPLAERK